MDVFRALIEIQAGAYPVKYEMDKLEKRLCVDRIMSTSMVYPCHYGYFLSTKGGDGDPLDVLVYARFPIIQGALIDVRPIGMLDMEDEAGVDEKILAVPSSTVDAFYDKYTSYKDIYHGDLAKIEHFFKEYKILNKNKWTKIVGWKDADDAIKVIKDSIL